MKDQNRNNQNAATGNLIGNISIRRKISDSIH
jgi:hypothetical protein